MGFLDDRCRRDRYRDVLSCSAFAAPWYVSCDKRCLNLPEAYKASTTEDAPWMPGILRSLGLRPLRAPGNCPSVGGKEALPHGRAETKGDR